VRLEDRQVSKHHAVIRCADDGCHIEDLGSHNGVYVNGQRVTVTAVEHGDEIEIGPYSFTFQSVPRGTPFPSPRNGTPKPRRRPSLFGLIANRRAQETLGTG
jgi:pSer/pThr/pTyr-binding forkhead associated (FHA) protein